MAAGWNTLDTLKKWTMTSTLNPEVLQKVRLAYVFGKEGNDVLLSTTDDQVLGFGRNSSGCLGIGTKKPTLQPSLVKGLQGEVVVKFVASSDHVLCLTQTRLYAWGSNEHRKLGRSGPSEILEPQRVQFQTSTDEGFAPDPEDDVEIADVACAETFSLVLTKQGKVYMLAELNPSLSVFGSENLPGGIHRLVLPRAMEKVKTISCGPCSMLAASGEGKVYFHNFRENMFYLVSEFSGCFVHKVASGPNFNLALTRQGQLFCWRSSNHEEQYTQVPKNMNEEGQVFVDVAARNLSPIFSAMTLTGEFLVWGEWWGQTSDGPTKVSLKSFHEIMGTCSRPAITHEPIVINQNAGSSMLKSLHLAFDDPETADLQFVQDGLTVNVHKSYLAIRSEYYRGMFRNDWEESQKVKIQVPLGFSFSAFRNYLRYLYTDELDATFEEEVIEILEMASLYMDPVLKNRCQQILELRITLDNAALIYALAVKFEASILPTFFSRELEERSFRFCNHNLKCVCQTESYKTWDGITLKSFVDRMADERV